MLPNLKLEAGEYIVLMSCRINTPYWLRQQGRDINRFFIDSPDEGGSIKLWGGFAPSPSLHSYFYINLNTMNVEKGSKWKF